MRINLAVNFIKKAFTEQFAFALAMPSVIWQTIFLILPTLFLVWKSFHSHDSGEFIFLQNYEKCFKAGYIAAIFNSIGLAYFTALATLLFCIPLALIINFQMKKSWQIPILFFLMMPSWTNFIVRIYSWFFMLKNDGFLTSALLHLGLISPQTSLLANSFAVKLVMIYCYFPFMLIPISNAFAAVDYKLIEASSDLGASSIQTFFKVILPMSMKNMFFGFLVVLLASFGEFAIPEFIGGGKSLFWGNLVVNKFLFMADYNMGAALIFCGIGTLFASLLAAYILLRIFLKFFAKQLGLCNAVVNLKLSF